MYPFDLIFLTLNVLVLPFWGLLLFAPRWKWTQILSGLIAPLILSVIFIVFFVIEFPSSGGKFGSITDLKIPLTSPFVLLAMWTHYLAFDLFIGAWEVRDSQRLGIPFIKVFPHVLLTMLLGPFGFIGYLFTRFPVSRTLDSDAS